MKFLRHPVHSLKEPFGKAGLIVAILALVLAMVGGAWAAGALSGKQKKEVEKIAKKFQGTGPAGAQGPAGASGKEGPQGKQGEAGKGGINGTNGASVKVTSLAFGQCTNGQAGAKFTVGAEEAEACNGDPAEYPETLPSGRTEKGVWALGPMSKGSSGFVPITFPIPLAAELAGTKVHYTASSNQGKGELESGSTAVKSLTVTQGAFEAGETISGTGIPAGTTIAAVVGFTELTLSAAATSSGVNVSLTVGTPPACTGGTAAAPIAEKGNLCIYQVSALGKFLKIGRPSKGAALAGADPFGADALFIAKEPEEAIQGTGTWAVTAP